MNRVLVVDDEPAMRAALEANFTRHGWEVTTASGTREAMERFRSSPCPLVITDMRMPDGDGLGVMQHVRALAPDTAVIFLTAFGNVPEAVLEKEKEIARDRARLEGKPERVLDRIIEGRIAKFYEEVCLLDQPFVKEATVTIEQLVKAKIAKLGENIGIARFTRFKVGDVAAAEAGQENPALAQ